MLDKTDEVNETSLEILTARNLRITHDFQEKEDHYLIILLSEVPYWHRRPRSRKDYLNGRGTGFLCRKLITTNWSQLSSTCIKWGSWLKNSLVTLSHMDIIHISFLTILLLGNISQSIRGLNTFPSLSICFLTTFGLDLLVSGDGVFKKPLKTNGSLL